MDTITTQGILLATSIVTLFVTSAVNVKRYRSEKVIDREYSEELQEYREVVSKILKHDDDIEYLKRCREADKKEDMARMRIELVSELKRCIQQNYRTMIDIESIDPLLDIYFDEQHKGNGVVKELSKVYHNLEIKSDNLLS